MHRSSNTSAGSEQLELDRTQAWGSVLGSVVQYHTGTEGLKLGLSGAFRTLKWFRGVF